MAYIMYLLHAMPRFETKFMYFITTEIQKQHFLPIVYLIFYQRISIIYIECTINGM